MSHMATNWAIEQRGLKPATKLVLWYLCDRYHPDHGCFPSQDTMAYDCEMSRSTLNVHLSKLEEAELIYRKARFDKRSHKQKSTLYILGCQSEFEQYVVKPCPESGHGKTGKAVSGKQQKPCPENGQSRVRNPDTNPVREPVIDDDDSAREKILVAAGHDKTGVTVSGRIVGQSWEMLEVARWQQDLGLSLDEILMVISDVMARKRDGPPSTLKYFTKPMQAYAAEKQRPDLEPSKQTGGRNNEFSGGAGRSFSEIIHAAAAGTSGQDWG